MQNKFTLLGLDWTRPLRCDRVTQEFCAKQIGSAFADSICFVRLWPVCLFVCLLGVMLWIQLTMQTMRVSANVGRSSRDHTRPGPSY